MSTEKRQESQAPRETAADRAAHTTQPDAKAQAQKNEESRDSADKQPDDQTVVVRRRRRPSGGRK